MLAAGPIPVERSKLPPGKQGTDVTVAKMSQLSMGPWGAQSPKVRALATDILSKAGVPEKNYPAEMVAIHNWVRDNVRYTRDTHGQETLLTPEYMISGKPGSMNGDCDDKAMLVAALLGAVGIPSRFVVVGVTPDRYSHVYLQAKPKDRWIALDPIMRQHIAGWELPNPAIKKIYPENEAEGFAMNGLGYVGDPRVWSFLDEAPPSEPEGTPYVAMNSMMDTNQAMDSQMAFPPNANLPYETPAYDAMSIAVKGMGAISGGVTDVKPRRNMQTQSLAAIPEGADSIFARPAKLFSGLPVMHFGPRDLAQRTPGRPVSVAGIGDAPVPVAVTGAPLAPISKPWLGVAVAAGLAYFFLVKHR